MKINWTNVVEIAIGVFLATLIAGAVVAMFAKWLAKHGESIHGVADTTAK